jgi:hypothetical protein
MQSKCTHAQGRLFNAAEEGSPGRVIGTISGDYWIDFSDPGNSGTTNAPFSPDGTDVFLTWAPSYVEGPRGTIFLMEYGALDFAEQAGPNGGVLVIVTGGTGQWEGASGHLALSGYFHTDEGTGVWDYQGEVCRP